MVYWKTDRMSEYDLYIHLSMCVDPKDMLSIKTSWILLPTIYVIKSKIILCIFNPVNKY